MGYTFRFFWEAGGVDAVEGEFGNGRAPLLCRPPLRRRANDRRDFGISRKTGYKIFDRYNEHGLQALTDRSRRPAIESEGCMRRRSQNNVGVFNIVGF
jgi:hypothetical protein